MQSFDIIISGGGMVGMSMAIAAAKLGVSVALIERGDFPAQLEPQFDGRVSAIAAGSVRLLSHLGAWEMMREQAQQITDIRVSDDDSNAFLHYDHHEIGSEPFGYIVENRVIRHALQQAAMAQPGITLLANRQVASYQVEGARAHVSLSDGSMLSASLVLAADGKFSALRTMAGIAAVEKDYAQTAIVCTIAHEKPHQGLAQERFLAAGPFAVLPMTDNRSSLVWVEPEDRAPIYLALPKEEIEQEITERVGNYLGRITLQGSCFTYPLSLMHAKNYIAPRLALIGDAAHGIHPIAGQGVNLGFRDVAVLEELIAERVRVGLDIGAESVLEHYQRWRRFDNVTMMGVTDGLNHLFLSSLLPIKSARRLGLKAVSHLPGLKKFFMRHAMGLVGDLPRSFKKVS